MLTCHEMYPEGMWKPIKQAPGPCKYERLELSGCFLHKLFSRSFPSRHHFKFKAVVRLVLALYAWPQWNFHGVMREAEEQRIALHEIGEDICRLCERIQEIFCEQMQCDIGDDEMNRLIPEMTWEKVRDGRWIKDRTDQAVRLRVSVRNNTAKFADFLAKYLEELGMTPATVRLPPLDSYILILKEYFFRISHVIGHGFRDLICVSLNADCEDAVVGMIMYGPNRTFKTTMNPHGSEMQGMLANPFYRHTEPGCLGVGMSALMHVAQVLANENTSGESSAHTAALLQLLRKPAPLQVDVQPAPGDLWRLRLHDAPFVRYNMNGEDIEDSWQAIVEEWKKRKRDESAVEEWSRQARRV